MNMNLVAILNYASIVALAFMSYGIVLQWLRIYKTKSVKDIEPKEVAIRWTVTMVLLVKLVLVQDPYLIIGQLILAVAISLYAFTLLIIKLKK